MISQEFITAKPKLVCLCCSLQLLTNLLVTRGPSSPQHILSLHRQCALALQKIHDTWSYLKSMWKIDYSPPYGFSISEDYYHFVLYCSHF